MEPYSMVSNQRRSRTSDASMADDHGNQRYPVWSRLQVVGKVSIFYCRIEDLVIIALACTKNRSLCVRLR